MVILSVDLSNINLDNDNKYKQCKAYTKIYKQRINACSMASYKMVGLVHTRRPE